MGKKVYVENAGCNRRQLDLHKIRRYLEANNYTLVPNPQQADYLLVSTCAFKEQEEECSVARLRALRKYQGKLLVYGCLPDIAPQKYEEFQHIPKIAPKELHTIDNFFDGITVPFSAVEDVNVLTATEGGSLRSMLRRLTSKEVFTPSFISLAMLSIGRRLRTLLGKLDSEYFLFICRGCQGKCAYCAIRNAVGPVRSKEVEEILTEFRCGYEQGYSDFAILGDDPGCYGLDLGINLPTLLSALGEECSKIRRDVGRDDLHLPEIGFHLKEVHPKFMVRYQQELSSFCDNWAIKSILCPIQSGNDRILMLMQREHSVDEIERVLARIREANPQVELTTQIIVGFPGESEAEFQDTLQAVARIGFNSVVVFPYHDKKGAASSFLENKISKMVIRKRMREAFRYFRTVGVKAYYNCP